MKTSGVLRSVALPHDVQSAARARRCVDRLVADEGLTEMTEVLWLIASELVTNAVMHGTEPIELTLRSDNREVTIEVADGDEHIHKVRPHSADHTGGRGLRMIAALADRWGIRASQYGKTVWATVRTLKSSN
jgi:anti-sigma regulatory factor (Ser/Thr protein kinase)